MVDVFLDEKYVGEVQNVKDFINSIRDGRRKGKIPASLNVHYDKRTNEIYINIDSGRARRPLIVVENGKRMLTDEKVNELIEGKVTWNNLVESGVIEYIDAGEEESILVAIDEKDLTKDHTHLEISPITILGLCTSLVPYSNYGSSSRLIRGSKIQKQALGLYTSNFLIRMDTDVSVLHYPQKPLVKSFMHDVFNYNKHPSGQNIVIAVMSYSGYNMEDSIILNQGSIDRGLARSSYFRPYISEELRYSGGLMDEIGIPDKETKGYKSENDYRYLEEDGIVYTGANVGDETVILGKTSPPRFLGDLEEFSVAANIRRESSTTTKHGEKGIIDMTVMTENGEGNRLIQIRLRNLRIPEVGDKFASRHGQKGVIGRIIPQADMPFTANGITPDIIFSPHGIPGRMTVSHLIEILAGKVGALRGEAVDGTTFDPISEEDLRQQLLGYGFRENGTETMYDGLRGRMLTVKIYIGNIYYLKLKHMVANKLHARASGRIQLLTRQPIEGRAKGGGLRVGEMEKDCFIAHGASLLLKERFDSDKTIIHLCEGCGMVAIHDAYRNKNSCPKCGSNVEISAVEISYAFKLLLDELKSLCVYPRLNLKGKY